MFSYDNVRASCPLKMYRRLEGCVKSSTERPCADRNHGIEGRQDSKLRVGRQGLNESEGSRGFKLQKYIRISHVRDSA